MDDRRTYYDHEPAYRKVLATGGTGWDDACPSSDSYRDLDAFLAWAGLATAPGRRALEIGCGGGQAALRVAAAGFHATGLDFAPSAVALARANAARAGVDATFVEGDVLTLAGLPDAGFDLVIDNHLSHCIVGVPHRTQLWAAVRRVLAPGGLLFVSTMSAEGAFDAAVLGVDPATRSNRAGNRYWIREAELRAELEAAGLSILHRARVTDPAPSGDDLVAYARG